MTQRQEKSNIPTKEIQHIAYELNESNNDDERYCQNSSQERPFFIIIFCIYVAVLPYFILLRFFGFMKYWGQKVTNSWKNNLFLMLSMPTCQIWQWRIKDKSRQMDLNIKSRKNSTLKTLFICFFILLLFLICNYFDQ